MTKRDDIMAKHGHARELSRKLNELCRELLQTGPETQFVPNAEKTRYDVIVSGVPTAGQEIALLAGDIIHNLRSVLDHLAWELADPMSRSERTDFPILEVAREHDGTRLPAAIKGVHDHRIQKIVEAVQPYNRPNPSENFLWLLDQFDIIDKHRLLLTTFCVATGTAHGIHQVNQDKPILEYFWDQLGDNETFAQVTFDEPVEGFAPNFSITLEVAIRPEGSDIAYPVKNTVFLMAQEVAMTVNQFSQFL